MTENPQPTGQTNMADEIRNLGQALGKFLKAAWATQESQEMQRSVQDSLKHVGDSLSEAAQTFEQSETGQRIKSDLHDFAQRVESGEVQNKVHTEILSALRKASIELEKVTEHMSASEPTGSASSEPGAAASEQEPPIDPSI